MTRKYVILILSIFLSQYTISMTSANNTNKLSRVQEDTQRIEKLLEYFNKKGIVLEKQVLYEGRVINYLVVNFSKEDCKMKTAFRTFPIGTPETKIYKDLIMLNRRFYYNRQVGIVMRMPWVSDKINKEQKEEFDYTSSQLIKYFLQYNLNKNIKIKKKTF